MNVYFDDVTMTYKRSRVSQYNACPSVAKRRRDYYPFGLQTANSWTRENSSNNYLYNAANELNANTQCYETFFRGYDPALGRFLQVDPLSFSEQATYQYAGNNPVMFNDPLGDKAHHSTPWELKAERDATLAYLNLLSNAWGEAGGGGFHSHSGGNSTNWADGIKYSDWTLSGGSEMYQKGLAAGLTDVGGTLYSIENDGTLVAAQERNGELGFWMDVYTDHYTEGRLEGSTYEYTYFKPLKAGDGRNDGGKTDPLKDPHGQPVFTLEEFLEANKGKSYDEIINQSNVRNGLPGGPEMRMVRNPKDGNIMDMRHVMVVGYRYGRILGYMFEITQLVRGLGQAFNGQDLYSNAIGEDFFIDTCQCRPYQTAASKGEVDFKTTGDWTQDFYNWMMKQ